MKKYIILPVILLFVVGIILTRTNNTDEVVTIGFIGPIGSGNFSFGLDAKFGAESALAEINADKYLKGRKLSILFEDGKCNGKDALSAYEKLTKVDNLKILIGGICSGEVFAISPVAEKEKILILTSGAASNAISQAGEYIFRNWAQNKIYAEGFVTFLNTKGYQRSVLVHEKTEFGENLKDEVTQRVQPNATFGIATDEKDFRTLATQIKNHAPDVTILASSNSALAVGFLKQMIEGGARNDIVTIAAYPKVLAETLQEGEEGLQLFILQVDSSSSNPKRKFILERAKDQNYTIASIPQMAFSSYDAVYLLADAIKANEFKVDPEFVKQYLHQTKNYPGALGMYSFDQNGDIDHVPLEVIQVKPDGTMVNVQKIE